MAAIKRTDIIGDTMYITTQKTNDRLPINLNKFAKEGYTDKSIFLPDAWNLNTSSGSVNMN